VRSWAEGQGLPKPDHSPHVLPGNAKGKLLSAMAMTMQPRRMRRGEITVYGFRSTFRDRASEQTQFRMRRASTPRSTALPTRPKPRTRAATNSTSVAN
jgi:hypothetical protein